jgi:hypothetical protein
MVVPIDADIGLTLWIIRTDVEMDILTLIALHPAALTQGGETAAAGAVHHDARTWG